MVTHPARQQQSVPQARPATYDDVEIGLAVDTRKYQSLLRKSVPVTHASGENIDQQRRHSHSPPRYGILAREDNAANVEDAVMAEDVVIDQTVRGLPVETRNYQALVNNGGPPLVGVEVSGADAASNVKFALSQKSSSNNTDEEEVDAVLGLPISTGNYVALGGDNVKGKNSRPRGYSDLANVAERRISAPAIPGNRSTAQYSTAPAVSRTDPRGSCFDTRRASTVAVVPQAGWLYIQSKTFKVWKKHFAVLSGLEFRYSKGPGQPPKGFDTVRSVQEWHGMPFGIKLVLSSGRDFPVYCDGPVDFGNWMAAFQRSLEKQHNQSVSSKSYALTASEQHEGYMFRQETRTGTWRQYYFVVRIDGYIECKVTEDASAVDKKHSGYIKAVSFADEHPNGIAIQLDSGTSMIVYTDTYDSRMLWYGAMSSAAMANDRIPNITTSVKSTYVQTARPNHAGWMHKQSGLFKSWKRFYFTLHGNEMSFSKDTTSSVVLCDKIHSVEDWTGKQNGLELRFKSGRVWRVYAESYDSAKRWRSLMVNSMRHGADQFSVKRYVASRKRKGLPPVFGGWLTSVKDGGMKIRQFYVVDGDIMGFANEVDHQLKQLGQIVNVSASRDLNCGLVITFASGAKLKLAADSIDSYKSWYEILKSQ
ncbi:Pleckstrin homology-like domain, partial [Globisporangium splendens]